MEYKTIICGGTFDRLHEGHKYFLREIFAVGERVLIGLTSDTYTKEHKKVGALSFQERLKQLKTFLAEEGLLIRAEVFPIQDVYGRATDPTLDLDAIAVSALTKHGGEDINAKRKELGLPELPIIEIPLLKTSETVLSSSKIREGKLGRNGEIYLSGKWTKHLLQLPIGLREILHKPFHTLMTGPIPRDVTENPMEIVTVGDATTQRFNKEGITNSLSVIDFSIERKALFQKVEDVGFEGNEEIVDVINPAGHLTPAVWEVLEQALEKTKEKRVIVRVDGEEDLLVIPLILLLPLGWKLFYGQPKEGVVYVPITEEVKQKVYNFLVQFVPE